MPALVFIDTSGFYAAAKAERVDALSFVMMERLGTRQALSFDRHFPAMRT